MFDDTLSLTAELGIALAVRKDPGLSQISVQGSLFWGHAFFSPVIMALLVELFMRKFEHMTIEAGENDNRRSVVFAHNRCKLSDCFEIGSDQAN